jgi:hypothetical protein
MRLPRLEFRPANAVADEASLLDAAKRVIGDGDESKALLAFSDWWKSFACGVLPWSTARTAPKSESVHFMVIFWSQSNCLSPDWAAASTKTAALERLRPKRTTPPLPRAFGL